MINLKDFIAIFEEKETYIYYFNNETTFYTNHIELDAGVIKLSYKGLLNMLEIINISVQNIYINIDINYIVQPTMYLVVEQPCLIELQSLQKEYIYKMQKINELINQLETKKAQLTNDLNELKELNNL